MFSPNVIPGAPLMFSPNVIPPLMLFLPLETSPPGQYPNSAVGRSDLVRQHGDRLSLWLSLDVALICAEYLVPANIAVFFHGLRSDYYRSGDKRRGNYDNWMHQELHTGTSCFSGIIVTHATRFGAVREHVNRCYTISPGWELKVQVQLGSESSSILIEDRETVAEVIRDHQMSPELERFRTTLVTFEEKVLRTKYVELASDGKTVQHQTF